MKNALAIAALVAASLACTGCTVEKTHDANGAEHVKIATPFGGLKVRAKDSAATAADIGLPQYPGAVPVKDGDKGGSANVDMGFGNFRMTIKVASFATDDPQDKIVAFYKKALATYGDVIICEKKQAIGKPDRTSEGLTCQDSDHGHAEDVNIDDGITVKAGSKHHQRLVAVENESAAGKRTKFAMVELELPNTDDKQNQ